MPKKKKKEKDSESMSDEDAAAAAAGAAAAADFTTRQQRGVTITAAPTQTAVGDSEPDARSATVVSPDGADTSTDVARFGSMPSLLSALRRGRSSRATNPGDRRESDAPSGGRVSPLGSVSRLRTAFQRSKQSRQPDDDSDDQQSDYSPLGLRLFHRRHTETAGNEDGEGGGEGIRGHFRAWQADRERHKEEELEFARKLKEKQRKLERSHLEEEISVLAILGYLCKDVRKTRLYRSLPWYILFMAVFIALMVLSRFESRDAQLYYRNTAMKRLLLADDNSGDSGAGLFLRIQSEAAFWTWLRGTQRDPNTVGVVDTLWGDRAFSHNTPLAFLVLRQWRVKPESCDGSGKLNHIAPQWRPQLPTNCYSHYHSGARSSQPYGGPVGQEKYFAVEQTAGAMRSVSVEGLIGSYDDLGSAFMTLLPIQSPKVDIDAAVLDMENSDWIDEQTRAIAVGLVTFNQPDGIFVYAELTAEVTESGVWIASVRSRPFAVLSLSDGIGIAIFALDCLILLWIVKDTVFLVVSIKRESQFALTGFIGSVSGWNVFYAIIQAASVTLYYYRVQLWVKGLSIGSTYYQDNAGDYAGAADPELNLMYQTLVEYSDVYTKSFNVMSVLLPMCWLRIFSFVQYNARLNALTETAKMALAPLISLGIIFVIVWLGFTMGGHILYGYDVSEFQSVLRTAGHLLRVLVAGEIEEYQQYRRIHSLWTACFFIFWFVLGWLLILNVVLAIITGSYTMVQDLNTKTLSWNPVTVFKDARHWCLKMGSKAADPSPDSSDAGMGGEEGFTENYLAARVRAYDILKRWFVEDVSSPEFITHAKLTEFLGGRDGVMSQKTIDRLFMKASLEVSAGTHTIRVGERWAEQMKVRLRVMEQQLVRVLASQHILERLSQMSQMLSNVTEKVDTQGQTLTEVTKKSGSMCKDIDRVHAVASDSHRMLESQLLQEIRRMQSGIAGLEGTNRDVVTEMAKNMDANLTRLRQRVNHTNKKLAKASTKPSAAGGMWGGQDPFTAVTAAGVDPTTIPDWQWAEWYGLVEPQQQQAEEEESPRHRDAKKRRRRSPRKRRGRGTKVPEMEQPLLPPAAESEFLEPGVGWDSEDPPITSAPQKPLILSDKPAKRSAAVSLGPSPLPTGAAQHPRPALVRPELG
eukprot:TRINITY_DN13890_c0_g1_i2.p1 TRINITY_DN13890_c0_g1~~TRINITY_DN13890_c0_g1_i2.p1  ORF type:complete len:1171 (+),score=195.31 TRINITY_DN13890_c0_g1_i2:79-3513(+)